MWDSVALNPSENAPVPVVVMLLLYHIYRQMSRANLRKNRKNPLIPSHALTNFGHADPVHRFQHERPLVLRFPRDEDDNPVAVECFHPNVVQECEPSSVSVGVGSGVKEDFKIHLIFPKRVVVCYASIIIYIGTNCKRNPPKSLIFSEIYHIFLSPPQRGRRAAQAALSPLIPTTYDNSIFFR